MLFPAYAFFSTMAVALLLWPVAVFVGINQNILDYPGERKVHRSPTLRTGGILIFTAFLSSTLIFRDFYYPKYLVILLLSFLIFGLGFFEDKYGIRPKRRLAMQAAIAALVAYAPKMVLKDLGIVSLPEWFQVPFTIFAVVGVTNAFNIIDGLNSLSSGLGIIATAGIAVLAHQHNDYELFICAISFAGAIGGFMVFNLRGKIFMGDSGSYLVGFIIALLSILLIRRNPSISPFVPFLLVFVPVFDTLLAIYRRSRRGKNPFAPDEEHIHHVLRRRLGSDGKTVCGILLLQVLMALSAVVFHGQTPVLVMLTALSGVLLFLTWQRWGEERDGYVQAGPSKE